MTDLSSKAMLASLSRRMWQAKAIDSDLSKQTEVAAEAEAGTMRVIKELAPKEYVSNIRTIAQMGYQEHVTMTVPGLVRGQHLLSTAMFDRYAMIQSEIRDQFNRAVDDFCEFYPDILERAPQRLGHAFKEDDFPSVHGIRSYFEYRVRFMPVPSVKDWRLEGVSTLDAGKLRNEVEDEVRAMFNAATQEVYERAREVLQKIANQAKEYVGGPGSALLRDATINNLKEISELICKMNVTNDPLLNQIGKEMVANFADLEGEEIRRSAKLRDDVLTAAERILSKFAKTKKE